MTEDYKQNLLKYLTGNLNIQNPSTDLSYENPNLITTNLSTQLNTEFPNGFSIRNIISGRNINGNTLNYNVLYGTYTNNSSQTRGFITIIDESGNLVQIISQYSSGADIGQIFALNVDEEGYFYMIESNPSNDTRRFVMLNNIVIKTPIQTEYEVKIRKSYNFPNTTKSSESVIRKVVKAIGQSKYLMAGFGNYSEGQGVVPIITELVVNVGEENEWTDYEGTQWTDPDSGRLSIFSSLDLYAEWQNDNLNFVLITHPISYPNYVVKYYKDNDNVPYTNIELDMPSGTLTRWSIVYFIKNMNTAYYTEGHNVSNTEEKHSIYEIDLNNNTITTIFEQNGYYNENNFYNVYSRFSISIIENELLFSNTYRDNTYCYVEIGRLRDDNYIPSTTYGNISTYQIAQIDPTIAASLGTFFVNKQYNLYNFNVLINDTNYNGIEIFNSNNYNGPEYENINSLVPNSGILYNGTTPIFARNLYDRTIIGNITTSTLQVPNTFLNDVNIESQNLISQTNGIIVENSNTYSKNIYEELLINYINTITMSNQNEPDNIIYNYEGAVRLNNSATNPNINDYSNCQATKYRINYQDGTTLIQPLTWNLTNTKYQTIISVYNTENQIISIDIISSDENTIYQTINCETLNTNQAYNIYQDVYIN